MDVIEKDYKSKKVLGPNDTVKTCKYIECGIKFCVEGVRCCCANTWESPVIISADEMASGKVSYELILERRKKLFEAINGLNDSDAGACKNCGLLFETKYKDVNFEYLGGHHMCSGFNIQHFTMCNLRCGYCLFTQTNRFLPPEYNNIIEVIEMFKSRNKLRKGEWIEYNGGEPTLLPNFEEILSYLIKNDIGNVCLFSNAVKYSQVVYDCLKDNKIHLTTSLDAGTPSTFKKLRGVDAYTKVVDNLIRYKKSGTNNLWIKYIICDENRSEDDLFGFVFTMTAINPSKVYICPNFPYGDNEIPFESVLFGARLWYYLEKYAGIAPYIQSDDMKADKKFAKFSADIRNEYSKLKKAHNIDDTYKLICTENKEPLTMKLKSLVPNKYFWSRVFAIKKYKNSIIIRIFRCRIKIK